MPSIPADKSSDECSEDSTSEGGGIQDLIIPLKIDNFFLMFFLLLFFVSEFLNSFLDSFFGGLLLGLYLHR